MWLKRLLKTNATGPAGGAGSDYGGSIPVFEGQGSIFGGEPPNREEMYNAKKRRQKRKMLERKRKWRSSRDRRLNQ